MLNQNEIKKLKIYVWWDTLFEKGRPLVDKLDDSKFFARLSLDIYLGKVAPYTDYPIHHYYMYAIELGPHFIYGGFKGVENKFELFFLRNLTLQLYVFWLFGLPLFNALYKHYPRYNILFDSAELNILTLWWEIPGILEEVVQFFLKENIYSPFIKDDYCAFETMFYIPFKFCPLVTEYTDTQEKCLACLTEMLQDVDSVPEEYIEMLYFYFTNTGLPSDKYKHFSKRDLITMLFQARYAMNISLLTTQALLSDWFVDFEIIRQGRLHVANSGDISGSLPSYMSLSTKEYLKKSLNLTDVDFEILSSQPSVNKGAA